MAHSSLGLVLSNFLSGRKQFVAVDGAYSEPSDVISGVPQGSVLGPILFLIHISDIDANASFSTVRSFADDTRVTKVIKSEEDCLYLQADLESIYEWSRINNMTFNSEKFELMRYSVHGCPIEYTYKTSKNTEIIGSTKTTDLGVIMSNSAAFTEQVSAAASRSRGRMGWILRVFATREQLPLMTLFRSLVLPLLEYCCQLWSPGTLGLIRQLEGVQRTFTYKISGMSGYSYWERLQHLKLYSLE